jgi:hypothetical protein
MRFESVGNGLAFAAAAVHTDTCVAAFGSQPRDQRFGLNRRYSSGLILGRRKPNSSKVEEYQRYVHRGSKITRHTRCGKSFVDRRDDGVDGFGADRRACVAEISLGGNSRR